MRSETYRVKDLYTGVEGTARMQTEMEAYDGYVWVEFDDGWKSYIPEEDIEVLIATREMK